MNVLLLSASDINGGAARASYRLHQGLHEVGIASQILVQAKSSNDSSVLAPKTRLEQGIATAKLSLDALPLKRYSHRSKATFSIQWTPDRVAATVAKLNPDIINLHWINDAYVKLETIARLNRPLVWTLHDMWAFTGGCHYSFDCDRYKVSCGDCPELQSQREQDLSRWIWQRKAKSWKNANLTIVALCEWMARCARASSLFQEQRIEVIPNGINTGVYRPIAQTTARELLQLPQNKHLVLFGSISATSDKRKGFHLLQPALQSLCQSGWSDRLELVVFGASQPKQSPDLGTKIHYLGTLNDDLSLALVYSAADVFVLPSIQENLANTVMEAIACGTPTVAFNIGGMPDMIEHQQNGYLAQPYQIEDLAHGIAWVLENSARHQNLAQRAREKVEQEFTQERQARRYQALFTELLDAVNRTR